MSRAITITIFFIYSLYFALPSRAQVAEVRAGISEFDEETLNLPYVRKRADENSAGINGEIIFNEPGFLKWALSPQPYIGGMINLEGKTSFGGGGLLWRQNFSRRIYGDFSFGLVAHTGTTNIVFDGVRTPENISNYFNRFDHEIEFGSRILFREQVTLGYRVSDDWAGELFIEHLSNGFVLDDTDNDGANILGIRAARRF